GREPLLEAVGQQRWPLGRDFEDAGRHGITGKPQEWLRRGGRRPCSPRQEIWRDLSKAALPGRLSRKRAVAVRYARRDRAMSRHRRGKALLCYYVIRAWLACTTPCVAETAEDAVWRGSHCIETSSVRAPE